MWQHKGNQRPTFARRPKPGQESVWDYPRPPVIVPCDKPIEVRAGEHVIARSQNCVRVLETASPPAFYIPPQDIDSQYLVPVGGHSICEWKGTALYVALADDPALLPVGWSYPEPTAKFAAIRDWVSFYPSRIACFVAGEHARGQAGGFYGGWITDDIVGPFKGDPGTMGW